jgi:hypothetical protein
VGWLNLIKSAGIQRTRKYPEGERDQEPLVRKKPKLERRFFGGATGFARVDLPLPRPDLAGEHRRPKLVRPGVSEPGGGVSVSGCQGEAGVLYHQRLVPPRRASST